MYIVYFLAFRASMRNISRRNSSSLSVKDNLEIRYSHKGLSCLHQKLWPYLLSLNPTDFHLELYCTFLCWRLTFELDQQIVMLRTAIQTRRKRDIRMSLAFAFHINTILHFHFKPTALLIFVDPHTSSSPPWQALHYTRRIYLT